MGYSCQRSTISKGHHGALKYDWGSLTAPRLGSGFDVFLPQTHKPSESKRHHPTARASTPLDVSRLRARERESRSMPPRPHGREGEARRETGEIGARSRVGEQLARWRSCMVVAARIMRGASARPTPVGRKKATWRGVGVEEACQGGEAKLKVQHPTFPRGPPQQYCLNSTPFHCAVWMGGGELG